MPPLSSDGAIQQALRQETMAGTVSYTSGIDGVRRHGSYRRLNQFDMTVLAAESEHEIQSSFRAELRMHSIILTCLAAVLIVLGGRLVRAGQILREQARQQVAAREHAASVEAERLRSTLMAERAEALKDLAHAFDGQVRTMVVTVAQTADQIRSRATALLRAAAATGKGADTAAALAATTASDTMVVVNAAKRLQDSLDDVCQQTHAAAEAAQHMSAQVDRQRRCARDAAQRRDQVGAAATLIGGIAAQTKLLSLNASIEAARAGEARPGLRRGRRGSEDPRQTDGECHVRRE